MEIAIISGKGGTGKSSISAAFASMGNDVVLADCDVDAANLFLLFDPSKEEEIVYVSGQQAIINDNLCLNCGICIDYCRFEAISQISNKVMISETACDGCKLCSRICPVEAISMIDKDQSRMYSGNFRYGKMVYGRLAPGEENSGKLVSMIRNKAQEMMKKNQLSMIIIDGPPGIGCPVISSITGVDKVLVVTEPTISGLHDLKRTSELTNKMDLKVSVLINKADLNRDMSDSIEHWCNVNKIQVAGRLPFDGAVVAAMVHRKSIPEWASLAPFTSELKKIWENLIN